MLLIPHLLKNCVLSLGCRHSVGPRILHPRTPQKVCVWSVFESHTHADSWRPQLPSHWFETYFAIRCSFEKVVRRKSPNYCNHTLFWKRPSDGIGRSIRDKCDSETNFDCFCSLWRTVSSPKPLWNQKKKGPHKGPSSVLVSVYGGARRIRTKGTVYVALT